MEHPTKRALLDCAIRLAKEEGMSAVTTQRVSLAAGVTKGAFFHYFPTRASLVLAMFEDVLGRFDADIENRLEADPEPRGSFTRAYVSSVFDDVAQGKASDLSAMAVAIMDDDNSRARWTSWMTSRDQRHRSTDSDISFVITRLAADGFWYSGLMNIIPADMTAIRLRLLADASV